MRAAVVEAIGGEPIVEEFPDPASREAIAEAFAAPLNPADPADPAIVAGQMPFRQVSPPFVAGLKGIARLADGSLRYFSGPKVPDGCLAERVPLAGAERPRRCRQVLTPRSPALGTSGLPAWL